MTFGCCDYDIPSEHRSLDDLDQDDIPNTESLTTYDLSHNRDKIIINVGGQKHETFVSTLKNFPDNRLFWLAERVSKTSDYDPSHEEFFFDRHPICFQHILNYFRTGRLHCPNDVCGSLFEEELQFWGIDELHMEPCCWGRYTQGRNAKNHLKVFDKIIRRSNNETKTPTTTNKTFSWSERSRMVRGLVWNALEEPYSTRMAQVVAIISLIMTLLSTVSFCIGTHPVASKIKTLIHAVEVICCLTFSLEIIVRAVCCPSRAKLMRNFLFWIDVMSVMPFYTNFITQSKSLDFLFVLRMLRIFRLFRFFKNMSGLQVILQTLVASSNELTLMSILVMIPMVIFSSLAYYAERHVNGTMFRTIPESFWWSIITMTTVGYGDVSPKSTLGKLVGSMCALTGVLIVALPVSVIGSNFQMYYTYAQARLRLPARKNPMTITADKALITAHSASAGPPRNQDQECESFLLQGTPLRTGRNEYSPLLRRRALEVCSASQTLQGTEHSVSQSGEFMGSESSDTARTLNSSSEKRHQDLSRSKSFSLCPSRPIFANDTPADRSGNSRRGAPMVTNRSTRAATVPDYGNLSLYSGPAATSANALEVNPNKLRNRTPTINIIVEPDDQNDPRLLYVPKDLVRTEMKSCCTELAETTLDDDPTPPQLLGAQRTDTLLCMNSVTQDTMIETPPGTALSQPSTSTTKPGLIALSSVEALDVDYNPQVGTPETTEWLSLGTPSSDVEPTDAPHASSSTGELPLDLNAIIQYARPGHSLQESV